MNKISLGLLIGQHYVGCSICGKLLHETQAKKSRFGSGRYYCLNPDQYHKEEVAKIMKGANL